MLTTVQTGGYPVDHPEAESHRTPRSSSGRTPSPPRGRPPPPARVGHTPCPRGSGGTRALVGPGRDGEPSGVGRGGTTSRRDDVAARRACAAHRGQSTAWVCVTLATRRPPSSRRTDSTTIVVRPTCSGAASAVTVPAVTPRIKLVFDSMVDVPVDPSGRLR